MKYRDIKVLEINPVVYLGEDFKNKDYKFNEEYFKNQIKNLEFEYAFNYECPIEDMISVRIEYEDNFTPIIQEKTVEKILSVTNELLKVFGKGVKINLYLDDFIEKVGNSVDMEIDEFVKYLYEEAKAFENKEDDVVNRKEWDEFRKTGLLWWINMILHTFGWSIVVNVNKDNEAINAYPARVKYRGFEVENNSEGYIKVSKYMVENAEQLLAESEEY